MMLLVFRYAVIIATLSLPFSLLGSPAQAQEIAQVHAKLASRSIDVQVASPPQTASGLISVNFVDADIRDVLTLIAQQSGLNIIASNDVQGRISLGLNKVPHEEGLKSILVAANLTFEKVGETYVVTSSNRPPSNMASLPASKPKAPGQKLVNLNIKNAELGFVVENLINQAGVDVVVLGTLNGKVTARVSQMPLEEALSVVFSGTRYGVNKFRDIYVIGDPNSLAGNTQALTETVVIPIRYLQAKDILTLLPPNLPSTMIKPNESANALIVTGTRDFLSQVRVFIEQVDIPTKQVILETTVLELSKRASKELGLTFSGQFGTDASLASTNPLVVAVTQGGNGVPTLSASFRALMDSGQVRVKANPKIAATNGQEAEINVIREVNVRVTTGAKDLVPITTIQTIQAGITFKMTPYIGSNGDVSTRMSVELSSISGLTPEGLPEVSRRKASTTMRLKDGETVAIGGILQTDSFVNTQKIPLLGDLPVLGGLFRTQSVQDSESELVIMLTPRVLR
ncbi:Type IV pilus biogenesis and competence protein PilQ precursor [compost metagenome]